MSSAEELSGEVRGFSGIFTDRYEGFTERTVDELYRIAVNIENSDKYAAASKILKEIYKHLDGEYTHDFKLSATDILNQLYQTYVDAGYDKSEDEFIKDVSKNIQIGTTEDIAAGINTDKAVDSVAWRRYWLEHLKSLGAHINIRNSISPNQCVNSYPIFYFNSNSQRYMKPTYFLSDKWNSGGMTMVFKYTGETGEVFRISFGSGDLIIECDDTNLVVKAEYAKFKSNLPLFIASKYNKALSYRSVCAARINMEIADKAKLMQSKTTQIRLALIV